MRGLILKGLRSRFHFSLPPCLISGRSERISGPPPGSIDDPVGAGMGGKIFHKI